MPDCNSGIRVNFVGGGGGGIPRILVRDESKVF